MQKVELILFIKWEYEKEAAKLCWLELYKQQIPFARKNLGFT
jgi:hypothetical protein